MGAGSGNGATTRCYPKLVHSIRRLALTELARITASASYSNSDQREGRRNPANA